MLRIYFVRHATAQDKGETLPDFERSLTKKGEKEAVAVARYLATTHPAPELLVSSFANRAIETAYLFAKAFRYPRQRILLRDTFYGNADAEDLVKEVRKQLDKYRSIMLFGHDPAFSRLASLLVKGFKEEIPKAGVVAADIPVRRWREIDAEMGRLVEFVSPDRLKILRRRTRTDLETRLARSIEGVLARSHRGGAHAYRKEARKAARKIAKSFLATLTERAPAWPGDSKHRAG
jgi:phosphohistidine phosphatase